MSTGTAADGLGVMRTFYRGLRDRTGATPRFGHGTQAQRRDTSSGRSGLLQQLPGGRAGGWGVGGLHNKNGFSQPGDQKSEIKMWAEWISSGRKEAARLGLQVAAFLLGPNLPFSKDSSHMV